jgi:hypothetical protein
MRPPRVAIGLALFTLGVSAPAWAGCAWILWAETEAAVKNKSGVETVTVSGWKIRSAEKSKAACEAARNERLAKLMAGVKTDLGATPTTVRDVIPPTSPDSDPLYVTEVVTYHCLPDTIDPRGPKTR